jgi:PAS domain S-box-containing protein
MKKTENNNSVKKEEYLKLMNCEAIFESSPIAMFILDETTNIVMVNLAAVKMCGGSEEGLVQHRPGDAFRCIHSSKDPRGCGYSEDCKTCVVRNAVEALISHGGSIHNAEVQLTVVRDGQPKNLWILVGVEPVNINDLNYWCVAINDVTEKKEIENSLKVALELLKNAGKTAKFGGWNVILSEDRSYWSDEVAAIHEMPYGYCPLVKDGIKFYAPEWRDKITQVFTDCAKRGTPYDEEMEILTSTGKRVWVRTNGEAVRDEKGMIYKVQGGFQDITEQKQAELALQKSEKRYHDLLVNLEAGIVVHAPDTSVLMNNRRASELLGLTDEQMKGKHAIDPLWKFVNENNKPLSLDEYPVNRMITGRQPIRNQILGIQKPGNSEVVWVSVNGFPVLDITGEITEIVISFIDITERKRTELALHMSLMKLRSIFDQSPVGSVVVGLDKRFQKCNASFCRFIGYSEDELIGKAIAEITHPEDMNLGMNELKLMAEGKINNATVEKRYVRKDGSIVWGQVSISIVRDSNNEPLYFLPVIQDITDRKRVENELRESEERFKALHNASFGGIAIHDKGIILECNLGLSQMTGYSLDELIGMDGLLLIAPGSRDKVLSNIIAGSEKPYESLGLRKNGEIYSIMLEARNVYYKGKSVRTVEFRDITEIKKAEETIKKRIDELESFHKLVVGRELKMVELKKEVNELLKAAGKKEKYES